MREGLTTTRRTVSMSQDACARLTAGKYPPKRCLEAAHRFLFDREPKESEVTVISRYFPEFEHELPRYLSRFDLACDVTRTPSRSSTAATTQAGITHIPARR